MEGKKPGSTKSINIKFSLLDLIIEEIIVRLEKIVIVRVGGIQAIQSPIKEL